MTAETHFSPNGSPGPILQIEGLSYRYPSGRLALDDINLSVRAGEFVGLIGPSGAGKSTLLKHFIGLQQGESGEPRGNGQAPVHVNGLPVNGDNLHEVRRLVGFLFQDPDDQLFCPTVREDVAFGPLNLGLSKDEVLKRVSDGLQQVGLADYEQRSTLELSDGERKRVCLAGVLACQPKLLALDEPFSNLDPRARRNLVDILKAFDGSQVIASHDLSLLVEFCHRIVVLDEGRIRADGPPAEILSDARLMDRHGLEVPPQFQSRP